MPRTSTSDLPRLPREYYQADAVVHWTLTIENRKTGWLTDHFHHRFRELTLHTASREGLVCPTYCMMPDHIHLFWMGLRITTDQLRGMAFFRTYLEPELSPAKFQHQAHDHVLKESERQRDAFAATCLYILNNLLKDELIENAAEWNFKGAIVPGYPNMNPLDDGYWERFWKVYFKLLEPGLESRTLPPIS